MASKHLALNSIEAFNCGHFNNILACRAHTHIHTNTYTNTHSCIGLRFVLFDCNCLIKVKSKLLAKSYIAQDIRSMYIYLGFIWSRYSCAFIANTCQMTSIRNLSFLCVRIRQAARIVQGFCASVAAVAAFVHFVLVSDLPTTHKHTHHTPAHNNSLIVRHLELSSSNANFNRRR